ncbi:hypothetical protein Tco_0963546, partial [Tanacetum coccineum]
VFPSKSTVFPLHSVTLDMDFEQLMYSQDYYAGQGLGYGNQDNYPSQDYSMGHGSGHGSAPVDDDSPAKKNDNKEPPKEWTTTAEIALCKVQGDLNLNDEAVESEKETQEERPIGRDRAKKKSSASSREGSSFVDLVADKFFNIKTAKWEKMKEQQHSYIQLKNHELDIHEAARREAANLKRDKLEIQRRALELAEKNKLNKYSLFYNSLINPSFPSIQQQKDQIIFGTTPPPLGG